MKKVLLTVMSGVLIALVSFNACSLTKQNIEVGMAEKTGLTRTQARNALEAFELQVKTELEATRGVAMSDRTYLPKETRLRYQTGPMGNGLTYEPRNGQKVCSRGGETKGQCQTYRQLTTDELAEVKKANLRTYTHSLTTLKNGPMVTQNTIEAGMSARNGMSVQENHRLLEAYKKTLEEKGGNTKGFYTKIDKPYYFYNHKK
jgi:hypothetical protein